MPSFSWRLLLLLGLVLLVGFSTGALAADPVDRSTPVVSRAEAVALLVSADPQMRQEVNAFRSHMPPLPLFTDTQQSDWYAPYLEVAFAHGMIEGNLTRTFRPSSLLLVEEALTLATRYKQRDQGEAAPVVLYLPGSRAHTDWFTIPLQAALSQGILMPSPLVTGSPVGRSDWYAMLMSAGIHDPADIAFVNPPAPPPPAMETTTVAPAASAPVRAPALAMPIQSIRRTGTRTIFTPRPVQAVQPVDTAPSNVFDISLPSLGIDKLTVSHPSNPFTSKGLLAPLQDGVGHLFSYPGKDGKILIYGHSSGYPWDVSKYTKIFRQINKLGVGDRVSVQYQGVTYVYQVTYKETVPAEDMTAYKNDGGEELILYTCWPPDSITQRYLVHAKPVEKIAAR